MKTNPEVNFAFFQSAISAPGIFPGEITLSKVKHSGIKMHLEPGMLIVFYKGQKIGIPTMNIKSLVFEENDGL